MTAFRSGRRGSNPRPTAWKAVALPTELLPRFTRLRFVKEGSVGMPAEALAKAGNLYLKNFLLPLSASWAFGRRSFVREAKEAFGLFAVASVWKFQRSWIAFASCGASAIEVGRSGFEPLKSKDSGFTVRPIWPLWNLPWYPEPLVGIEPTTY